MIDIESALFLKLVREKALNHPTSRRFEADRWMAAAKALENLSERDQQLLSAALHYGTELKLLRMVFEEKLFKGVSRRDAIVLVIAMANYNYIILMDKAKKQIKESKHGGIFHLGSASRPLIAGALPGNQATPDTVVATIVDTLPHCLERADKLPADAGGGDVKYWEIGSQVFASMSVEHSLRMLWQRVLWDGWKLDKKGAGLRHGPSDRQLATYWEVWQWRHEMVLNQAANLDALLDKAVGSAGNDPDPFVSPTATGIGGSSRETRAFRFGVVSGRESGQSWHLAEITALEQSYLAQFLDSALPQARNLTCRNLQQAWCVIRDCARILVTRAKERKFESIDSVDAMALLIRREEIERVLTHCLAVTASRCDRNC
jgi:hypothetical protein